MQERNTWPSMARGNLLVLEKKRVAQIDKNTLETIEIYESERAAGQAIGHGYSHIAQVCRGEEKKTAYGYIWRFADELEDEL